MQPDKSPLFDYMESSIPPRKWLGLTLFLSTIAVIIFWGLGAGHSAFYSWVYGMNHTGAFKLDPILGEYIPNKIPLFFKIVSDFYEIPFYHLAFGVLFKGLLLVTYFFLAWRMTGSTFASLIAVFMIFGLFKFEIGAETILNLKLPFVPDVLEFRHFSYLSFRQAAAPFLVVGTLFFLSRNFVRSSIFLSIAVYCHPHSGIIFFVALNLALLLCFLLWKNRFSVLGDWLKFAIPFLIIISPYMISALSAFPNVDPLPFIEFWELTLKNEPDDASTLYALNHTHPPYLLSLYLTLAAIFLHFLFKSKTPKIKLNIKSLTRDTKDMLWPAMLAPWTLVGFGYVWESGLLVYLPDYLNDIIAPLHIRRVSMVSNILYMPIFSMLIAKVIFVFSEKMSQELLGEDWLVKLKTSLKKMSLTSVDHAFAVGLSIVTLLLVFILKKDNSETFKKYWEFEPLGYEHAFVEKPFLPFMGDKLVPVSSFVDICNWIKGNTPSQAAFFNPPYLGPFRSCTKRQAFLYEKTDGNFAIADRKFATIYYKRFNDINKGLTYHDFPFEDTQVVIRKQYLSIDGDYLGLLKAKYPGYGYFMTETGHQLPYPVVYENLHFVLYDLSVKPQD